MARTRTTKGVAQRIDLNYFKRPTPWKRARLWLTILAPVAAVLWIGWHFLGRDDRVYSSGRLSAAHAVLEKQCVACHVQQAETFSAKAADSACRACHDGPPHHADVTSSSATKLACAECHMEHRGRVLLSATNSGSCAQCHGDLRTANKTTNYAAGIHTLEDGHPEFAALRLRGGYEPHDPGTIKLNHALHMKAIRRGPNGPTVQLECRDCHRPAASTDLNWEFGDQKYAAATVAYTAAEEFEPTGTRGLPAKGPWSGRQLMAPVKFANACAGCHLLTFDKRFEEGVPHDKPETVHAFLVERFTDYIAVHPGQLREVQDPGQRLAGQVSGPAGRLLPPAAWVKEQVAVAEELLWHKTCAQCHAISMTQLQDVKIARWDAAGGHGAPASSSSASLAEATLPTIAAARTTLQWLPHARFDHDAHTGFACAGCHPNALKSTESSDILIPGIAVCQTCHAPGPGYASSQCSECHTYHDWAQRKEVKPKFTLPAFRGGN